MEGSRTNILALRGNDLVSPIESKILPGVMRSKVIKVAKSNGYEYSESNIPLKSIGEYDALFLTSATSKIIPLKSLDDVQLKGSWDNLNRLMSLLNDYLKDYSKT